MRVERLVLGELQTNCFLVDDGEGGPTIVIDPAGDPERLLGALDGRTVSIVVLTHAHFDHLAAARDVIAATGAELIIHEEDAHRIVSPAADGTGAALFGVDYDAPAADRVLTEGDTVAAGSVSLEVIHTPGHTRGSICLLGDGHLFSGDTVFAGSVGRTDFPGGDARDLRDSIGRKLARLPDATVVHPGHGPDTTIGRERLINPFFPKA